MKKTKEMTVVKKKGDGAGMAKTSPIETNRERLLKHFLNPKKSPLPEDLETIFERYNSIHHLSKQGRPTRAIVSILCNDYGICKSQAYYDIAEAKHFFPSLIKTNKEFERLVIIEQLNELYQRARAINKLDIEEKILALKAKVIGLDKEDPNIPDFANRGDTRIMMNMFIGEDKRAITIDLDGDGEDISPEDFELMQEAFRAPVISREEAQRLIDAGA